MSVVDNPWTRMLYDRTTTASRQIRTVVFGDRLGLTLFLGALVFFSLYWRVGFFITDNFIVANTLVNVAEGHLQITHVVYGPESGVTPGMKIHDGRLYGIHYGVVFGAVPFLWTLQGLAAVADLRVLLVALWSLGLLAFTLQGGQLVDRRRIAVFGGSLAALGLFVLNVAVATPLDPRWLPMIALQTSTMAWAALLAVVLYRLTARMYDRRIGTFAGVAVVVATPVGFWASIPKRHVLVALLALLTIYCFYRSRNTATAESLRFRALAYGFVGLSAWVFPFEALVMFVALGPLDLLTARSNAPRRLAVVAGAFLVSLLPFALTNALVTGNPLEPIWFLPGYHGEEQVLVGGPAEGGGPTGGTGSTGGGGRGGSAGGAGSTDGTGPGFLASILPFVLSVGQSAIAGIELLWSGYIDRGLTTVLAEPERVYRTFVHSGYIERVAREDGGQAINLALLESMPLLGALTALPVIGLRNARSRDRIRYWIASPAGQTDVLVGVYSILISLAFLPNLPVHATVTARYLLPIIPALVFLMVRLPAVRATIRNANLVGGGAYAATVLIGGQLIVLALLLKTPSIGEAMQFHAWLGLGTATLLGGWALLATITDGDYERTGGVILGVTAGTTTVFLLLSGLIYFAYAGDFALPIIQRASVLIPQVN